MMITNKEQNSLINLSDSLNDIVNRNVRKMQEREQMKRSLFEQIRGSNTGNDFMGQGYPGHSLSQSLNLGDLLQGGQQDAVMRSAGKTPVQLPSFNPQAAQPQLPQAQAQNQLAASAEPDRSHETPALRARRELEEIKGKNAQRARVDKETFPYYKKIKDQYATTAEVDARLDEMEDLLSTGNVQEGVFIKGFEALSQIPYVGKLAGALQQAFLTNESQVFKKLSTDFLRDAKPYFGNNLSTREVELFLERVPNLMLTNEGNRAVIRNFRALNDYVKSMDKIMEGVIAENGGERPRHLESKVQERMKASAENLRRSFRESARLIPKKPVAQVAQKKNFTKEAYEKRKKLA
jgi:hypothetical protein